MNKKIILLVVFCLSLGVSERALSLDSIECYHNGEYFATITVDTCGIAHAQFSAFQANNCNWNDQIINPSIQFGDYVSAPVINVVAPGNGCFGKKHLPGQPPSLCVVGSNSNAPLL